MSSDIKDNKSLKSNEFDAIGNDHDGIAKSQRLSQEQDDVKRWEILTQRSKWRCKSSVIVYIVT